MNYIVLNNQEQIGTIIDATLDHGMCMLFGRFLPTPAYDAVRAIFQLFVQAESPDLPEHEAETLRESYYQQRDRLRLTLVDTDGINIETSFIHIVDHSGSIPGSTIFIEAQIPDGSFWLRPFGTFRL